MGVTSSCFHPDAGEPLTDPEASVAGLRILNPWDGADFSEFLESRAYIDDPWSRRGVQFWIRIFTQFTSNQGVLHDSKHLDRIYEVIDAGDYYSKSGQRRISKYHGRWRLALLGAHDKQFDPSKMNDDERHVFQLFSVVDEPNKFLLAAERIRVQLGQKDRFFVALRESGRYLPAMEEAFKKFGVPIEITRLPFVESGFNTKASSKVGAAGIWQFMRSTGKHFLRISRAVDERRDPVRATEAAAKLLKSNYERLRSWPLAIVAYNHGTNGMERAVKETGSRDLREIVARHHSPSFGFASRNFFLEFVAAFEVEKNSDQYFGAVERSAPVPTFEIMLPKATPLNLVLNALPIEDSLFRDLNPGIEPPVYRGLLPLPAGYRVRVPKNKDLGESRGLAGKF